MGGSWHRIGRPKTGAENVHGRGVGTACVKGKTGLGINDLEFVIMSIAKES